MEKVLAGMRKDIELYDSAIANVKQIQTGLAEKITQPERKSNNVEATAGAPLCESRDEAQRPEGCSFPKQGAKIKMPGGSSKDGAQRPAQGNAAKQRVDVVVENSRRVERYGSSRQNVNIAAGSKNRLKDGSQRPGQCDTKIVGESTKALQDRLKNGAQRPGQCSIGKQDTEIVGESAKAMEALQERLKDGAHRPGQCSTGKQDTEIVGESTKALQDRLKNGAQRPGQCSTGKQDTKIVGESTKAIEAFQDRLKDGAQRPGQCSTGKQDTKIVGESTKAMEALQDRLKDGAQRPGQCSIGKQDAEIVGESTKALQDRLKDRLKDRPLPSSVGKQHVKAVGQSTEARRGAEGRVARPKDGAQRPAWNFGIHKQNKAPVNPNLVCDWGKSEEEVEGPLTELPRRSERMKRRSASAADTDRSGRLKRQSAEMRDAERVTGRSTEVVLTQRQRRALYFTGVCALFVEGGVRDLQMQTWKEKFQSFGGVIFDLKSRGRNLTHVLAANENALQKFEVGRLKKFKDLCFLLYGWVQTCLSEGHLVSTEHYLLPNPLKPEISSRNLAPVHIGRPVTGENAVVVKEAVAAQGGEEVEEGSTSSDESENLKLEDKMKQKQAFYGKQDGPNLNEHLTNPLAEMWHIYEDVLGDQWRALSYRRLVNKLRSLQFKVTSITEIKHLDGIGASLLEKVNEILGTGHLQKLDNLKADSRVQTIQKFASVWGIGATQAQQFFDKGYREMQDLLNDESLSVMARMGLEYYEEINMRIPRDEVAEVERFLQEIVEALCPGAWVTAAGSFRRGQTTCGDIDILITHPDGSSHQGLLVRLVRKLQTLQFVVDGLNASDNIAKGGSHPDSFMGICRLQDRPHRRLDIRVYPKQVYAFALLAFTGNDVLNRKIRYLARRKGYKLSDQGLFVRESTKKGAKASTESIVCESEQAIFEKLGLPYPEPHERNW